MSWHKLSKVRKQTLNARTQTSKTIKKFKPRPAGNSINPEKQIIAIGASTGGTEAILEVVKKMPPDSPPIVIVIHMPDPV